MGLLLLEALGAMVLLISIVWWTMFSGRSKGEIQGEIKDEIKGADKAESKDDALPPPKP